ncbi:MFS transporter [Shouchella lonarensis]|uniref:MFS transporter, DHA1 family, multidrug resistance protein n=1 Tax=Shouchella lonarensis TaxID=1464122 RepID=A0A1G6J5L7_9BACI|nr:MFS transporter [Shouchella lonarensis]SDC14048.1 MFS transporter, DHA1 family, multidrug resistance protein [Shouchella lonarensis]
MTIDQRKKMIVLMINMFIAVASFAIVIPILPEYLMGLGEGGKAAGLIIALFAAAQFFMSPVAGKWADQYGRKKMIIAGLVFLTLSMFVFYFSNNIWIVYVSRIIGGIGAALLIPAIFAYIADITTIEQRARGNSLISASISLGIVVGPGIGGFFADFGVRAPLLASALLSVVAVLFSMIVLKESTQPTTNSRESSTDSMVKKIAQSVRKPYFIPLILTLVMSFGLLAYESVLSLFVDNQFGATPKQIALMITSTGLIGVIVQLFVVDRLVRRFGERRTLTYFLAVTTVGFLLSLFASTYTLFFVVTLFIFLATSILRPVITTLISKLAGNEQGFAMGMNNAYMSIGNVAGPVIAGIFYDVHIYSPFLLGFVVMAITTTFAFVWQRKQQRKENMHA